MSNPPLFSLAHDEVCHAVSVAGYAVGSYPAFSPLPLLAVYSLWHFLYENSLDTKSGLKPGISAEQIPTMHRSIFAPDVIRHRARMSPDFPRDAVKRSAAARLAPDSQNHYSTGKILPTELFVGLFRSIIVSRESALPTGSFSRGREFLILIVFILLVIVIIGV